MRSRGTLRFQGLHMRREHRYYVYILQSASRRAVYIGMTNNLHKRVWQHKNHAFEGFTDDYNAVRLVYWESFDDVRNAIDREKKVKGWRREKKLWLIAKSFPEWKDLAAEWYETQSPSTAFGCRLTPLGMTRLGSSERTSKTDETSIRKKVGNLNALRATS